MNSEPVELVDFVGDWTLDLVLVTRAQVPVLGEFITRTRSQLAVRLELRDGQMMQTQRVCKTSVNEGRGIVRTTIPAAFVAALPVPTFSVTLQRAGSGWAYAADFGRQVLGWDGVGLLPGPTDLGRLRDDDRDGHPGVTVRVTAPIVGEGEVYVVQAGRTRVRGGWDGVGFSGSVEVPELAQTVVGASNAMLMRGPEVVPDPSASTFSLRPGAAPCARLP